MAEQNRAEFMGAMHAYADSIEQDMAKFNAMHEDGMLTDAEHEQIMARLAGDHDAVTELITQFRRHQ